MNRLGKYIVCPCGKSFYVTPNRADVAIYCSRKCKGFYDRGRKRPQQVKKPINLNKLGLFTCKCGKEYYRYLCSIKEGVQHFCSKECGYKYRNNPTAIKKGEHRGRSTQYKKGHLPVTYKGDNATYSSIHKWVNKHQQREKCEHCGVSNKKLNWANKSHEYKRELDDWLCLCHKCHVAYDRSSPNYGYATKRFGLKTRKKRKSDNHNWVHAMAKKVIQMDKQLNIIKVWNSIAQAERGLKISHAEIIRACKKDNYSAGGYKWAYKTADNV